MNSDEIVDIGEAHHRAGRLQEAESFYQQALAMDPGHPGALFYLSNIAYADGRFEFAAQLLETLLRDDPDDAEACYWLAMVSVRQENSARAIEYFQRALALQPSYAQAHYDFGMLLGRHERVDVALEHLQKAVSLNPQLVEAYLSLGNVYRARQQIQEAISCYKNGLLHNPNSAPLYCQYAMLLMDQQLFEEAVYNFNQAIQRDNGLAEAQLNLGGSLLMLRRFAEAETAYKNFVQLMPGSTLGYLSLAITYIQLGKLSDAVECWRKKVSSDPDCLVANQSLLNFMHYSSEYTREQIFAEHVAFGKHFAEPLPQLSTGLKPSSDLTKRLRVGFVSPDLYCHPVGFFLESVLRELYSHDRVEIVIYATNSQVDTWTERMRSSSHHWFAVYDLSDEALVQKIYADKVDILIDLSGHNPDNRLLVFARKPAPIQISWLGYWDTTGISAIDYLLCDKYSVHVSEEKYFTEKLWYLPNTRLCFTPPAFPVALSPLPALDNRYITFGCFNSPLKITDQVIVLWSRILHRLENSRLLLKSQSFSDTVLRDSFRQRFARHGISAQQLQIEEGSLYGEHFNAYKRIDIALDPFPFPGGATTVEGLWMGVPILTLRGNNIISRQGESILHNLDMPDWIANDENDYIEKAVSKARDVAALAVIRAQLRNKLVGSPLCNSTVFATNLADAFEQMWAHYCRQN